MKEPTDEAAGDTDGCVGQDTASPKVAVPRHESELPSRQASNVPLSRRIRRMDDPEVLERVLAGLLDLP
jgi:hypothetical protein